MNRYLSLPDFQLTYARRKWTEERLSWRSVIQLNLVRNVNTILDALAREASEPSILSHTDADDEANSPIAQSPIDFPVQLADRYNRLNSRLFSLRKVQKDLETRLGAASSEETNYNGVYDPSLGLAALERKPKNAPEFTVNSSNGWKSALSRVLPGNTPDDPSGPNLSGSDSQGEKITEAIAACRTDIIALWSDPIVQEVFSRRSKRIQDAPGLYVLRLLLKPSSCTTLNYLLAVSWTTRRGSQMQTISLRTMMLLGLDFGRLACKSTSSYLSRDGPLDESG